MPKLFLPFLLFTLTTAVPVPAQVVEVSTGAAVNGDPNARRIEVTLVPGVTSARELPTPELVQARKTLVQKGRVPVHLLRQLADLGDGYAAYKFGTLLANKDDPALAADTAHYFAVAAATGRGGALRGMIKAVDQLDPALASPARLRALRDVLLAYARAGNSGAVDALLRYHLSEVPFGPMDSAVETLIFEAAAQESGQISLQLATAILQTTDPAPADLERARGYLQIAAASSSLSTVVTAQNLLAGVNARLSETAPSSAKEVN